jgi:hypothetical protein
VAAEGLTKRALLFVACAVIVAALGYITMIVAANIGIDTSLG